MSRLQGERETDRKDQEITVLKALLAKLQKYSNEGNNATTVVGNNDGGTNRERRGGEKKVRKA